MSSVRVGPVPRFRSCRPGAVETAPGASSPGGPSGGTSPSAWVDLHDSLGVVCSGSPDHKVVRIADQEGFSFQAGANFLLEPFVEHVVQEDVGQERADHAPNNVANHLVGGHSQKGMDSP